MAIACGFVFVFVSLVPLVFVSVFVLIPCSFQEENDTHLLPITLFLTRKHKSLSKEQKLEANSKQKEE
jgi:hypothetical protein